jgi:cyanophycinase-like exopeptidase
VKHAAPNEPFRLLVLIGSGEMAPSMGKVHRTIIRRLAGPTGKAAGVRAAIVDTPYGFQANVAALSASALDYFGRRLGLDATIASFRREDDVLGRETALERIRQADLVFSGPGSPSYALRQWSGTELPDVLVDKLTGGGALVVASAAALTVGRLTVPVYEIYKVGDDPFWLPGLDILSAVGISAAVVPHWDNSEGAGHDTRFCFLGERRLRALEEQMPDDTLIVGIDEHTALIVDLGADRATVHGRGTVTIRSHGRDNVHRAGDVFAVDELRSGVGTGEAPSIEIRAADRDTQARELARRVLELEGSIDDLRRRSALVEPLVAVLLDLRSEARAASDYARADAIRDRLRELGIEVSDTAQGRSRFDLGQPRQLATRSRPGATRS